MPFCIRCEDPIKVSCVLSLPNQPETGQLCIKCAFVEAGFSEEAGELFRKAYEEKGEVE